MDLGGGELNALGCLKGGASHGGKNRLLVEHTAAGIILLVSPGLGPVIVDEMQVDLPVS